MLEALKVIKDDNILLLVNSDDKPILIKSVKDESLIEYYKNLETNEKRSRTIWQNLLS